MGDWIIPISILLCYFAMLWFLWNWFDEILNLKFTLTLYFFITFVAIKWCFYLGSKSYTITYSTRTDEAGVEYYIEFPVIWM